MIFLVVLFLAMFVYGLIVGVYGASFLALFMAGFSLWSARHLDKRDTEQYTDPAHPEVVADTADELESQDCECSRSKF